MERDRAGHSRRSAPRNGDRDGAEEALRTALDGAEKYRLPHQVQRALRVASGSVETVADAARALLVRLDRRLSIPDS